MKIFEEIKDGKWHIDFSEWIQKFTSILIQWGLFPFAFYTLILTWLSPATLDVTVTNPMILSLICAYLASRLFGVALNPPHYRIDPEEAKETKTTR